MRPEDFSDVAGRVMRAPTGFWAFVPHPLPPALAWSDDLVTTLSAADLAVGELAGVGRLLPNPYLLIRPFMHQEAVFSSRIEGTRASLVDLYAHEAAVQLPLFEIPDDVQEVQNYVVALDYGLARLADLPISLRLVREVHAQLLPGVPGEFRRSPNWIGPAGSTLENAPYVPPSVPEMQQALSELELFLHAPPRLPALVRLGLFHVQFEMIHPFLDGNGRVGRLFLVLLLCSWRLLPQPLLYLSPYFEAHRQEYYDRLLGVSQRGEWAQWLAFFLAGVARQAQETVRRIQRVQDLRERYRAQVQGERASARLLQLVDALFARPVLTINQAAAALGVNYPIAQRHVERLEALGVLREITGRARNRAYRADAVLAAIAEPLPEEAAPAPETGRDEPPDTHFH
jgi:Fic family protein